LQKRNEKHQTILKVVSKMKVACFNLRQIQGKS